MCDTCQSCGCDNITLPVITGPTGAQGSPGPAGANGADGIDGVSVLHNDVVQSTTSSTSISLFSTTKAYTMPAGTLSTNGSKIRLVAIFSSTGITLGSARAEIHIGGSTFTANTIPYTIPYWINDYQAYIMRIELDITRINSTSLFVNSYSTIASEETSQVVSFFNFLENSTIVSDIDSNSLLFEVRGMVAGETTFNCDQLNIDHLTK